MATVDVKVEEVDGTYACFICFGVGARWRRALLRAVLEQPGARRVRARIALCRDLRAVLGQNHAALDGQSGRRRSEFCHD